MTDNSWQAKHSEYVGQVEKAARAAGDQARSEEQRRQAAIEGIRRDGQQKQAQLAADIDAITGINLRLREEIDRIKLAASKYSGTATGSKTAESAVVVLGELFKSASQRAGELAAAFGAARNAGLMCERSYDSLKEF
ncbi:DUF2514 family protein [Pseudomonas sp. S9]|uniref:DUF2514 family protein n=1 Tax=Pseudomonas sp. S9 TaxID=686578 RepID=UPI0009FBAD92